MPALNELNSILWKAQLGTNVEPLDNRFHCIRTVLLLIQRLKNQYCISWCCKKKRIQEKQEHTKALRHSLQIVDDPLSCWFHRLSTLYPVRWTDFTHSLKMLQRIDNP